MTHTEIEAFLRRLRELCPEFGGYIWSGGFDPVTECFYFRLCERRSVSFLRVSKLPSGGYHVAVWLKGVCDVEEELEKRLRVARKLGDMAILLRRTLNPLDTEEKDHE